MKFPTLVFVLLSFSTILKSAHAIHCYQCNSTQIRNQFQCGEFMESYDLIATSCDNVYGAKYCIKQVGHLEANDISCTDLVIQESDLEPEACDEVFEAAYCIKTTGMYGESDFRATMYVPASSSTYYPLNYLILPATPGPVPSRTSDRSRRGGLGTRRFCSSSDLGSYCNYVRQPGDTLQSYRSCFYTCSGDGCNSAVTIVPPVFFTALYSIYCLLS